MVSAASSRSGLPCLSNSGPHGVCASHSASATKSSAPFDDRYAAEMGELVHAPDHTPVRRSRKAVVGHLRDLVFDERALHSVRFEQGRQGGREPIDDRGRRRKRHQHRQQRRFVDEQRDLRCPEQHRCVPAAHRGRRLLDRRLSELPSFDRGTSGFRGTRTRSEALSRSRRLYDGTAPSGPRRGRYARSPRETRAVTVGRAWIVGGAKVTVPAIGETSTARVGVRRGDIRAGRRGLNRRSG